MDKFQLPSHMYKEDFIGYLIDLMDREDKEYTLSAMNYKIPGFSQKKYKHLPDSILRIHLKKALLNIKNAKVFYNSIIKVHEKEFYDIKQDEFILKLDHDKEIPASIKFILINFFYPELYSNNEEKLVQTLKNNGKIINIFPVSSSEILNIKSEMVSEDSLKKLIDLFNDEIEILKDENNENNKYYAKNIFWQKGLQILNHLYEKRNDLQIEGDNDFLDISILLIYEVLSKSEKVIKEKDKVIENLNETNKEQLIKINTLEDKINALIDKMEKVERKYTELKENYEKEINSLSSKNNEKDVEIKQKEEIIQQLYDEIQKINYQMEEDKSIEKQLQLINENAEIFLFNRDKENKAIEIVFGRNKTHYADSVDQLIEQISSVQHGIIFIVTNNLSTKDQFKIENHLKNNKKIRYRFISEDTKKIIRTSIAYLEGELRYEAIQ